jgi:1-acyl-sn-glycerol-3-phosphate acyltransferase
MTFAWPKNCVVILKSSLKYVPGFNFCAYLCCAIFINRFNKTRAHKSIGDAEKAILDEKVCVFRMTAIRLYPHCFRGRFSFIPRAQEMQRPKCCPSRKARL